MANSPISRALAVKNRKCDGGKCCHRLNISHAVVTNFLRFDLFTESVAKYNTVHRRAGQKIRKQRGYSYISRQTQKEYEGTSRVRYENYSKYK